MVKVVEAGNLIHTRVSMGIGVNKETEELMARIVPMLFTMVSCWGETSGYVFVRWRGVDGMATTLPDSIVTVLTILALYIWQPLMVTGVSLAIHPTVNKVELIMVAAPQVVVVVLLNAAKCQVRCIILCLSWSSHIKRLLNNRTSFRSCWIFRALWIL